MSDRISEDDAALVAHKVVLAHFVSEAQSRLGDDTSSFLDQIRRASIVSIERAQGGLGAADLLVTKRCIIKAIHEIFGDDADPSQ